MPAATNESEKAKNNNVEKPQRKRTVVELDDGLEYNKRLRQFHRQVTAEAETRSDEIKPPTTPEQINFDDDTVIPDPDCDPEHPRKVTFSEISTAEFHIKNSIVRTNCSRASQISLKYGMDIYFKKEYLQVTGSFKERGAR